MRIETPEYVADIRMATEADYALPWYDHTKLSAVNTCPTWAVLRYDMNKQMPMGRALALECGTAMHDVFAFVRVVTLLGQHTDKSQAFLDQVWHYQCTRLYGLARTEQLLHDCHKADDPTDICRRGAISLLSTSGYYDDPRDKRRTLSNMEESAYAYINRWRFNHPVWVRNPQDAISDAGIEIPFDMVVELGGVDGGMEPFRYTGRIDGVHWDGLGRLTVHDNKTSSRLGDAWTMAQEVSHQYTGYCIAASVFTQHVVSRCDVLGLAIPLPKAYDYGGFAREGMARDYYHLQRWLTWVAHSVGMLQSYSGDPYSAPKYTHSCNRYFRPCQFIPFCVSSDEDQRDMLKQMETEEWNPLHKKEVLEGVGSE